MSELSSDIEEELENRVDQFFKIDLILVHDSSKDNKKSAQINEEKRIEFIKNVKSKGIEIKHVPMEESLNKTKEFWLLHVPIGLMARWLYKMNIRLPVYDDSEKRYEPNQTPVLQKEFRSKSFLNTLLPFSTTLEVEELELNLEPYRRKAPFNPHFMEDFENSDGVFVVRNAVRSAVANRILRDISYSVKEEEKGLHKAEDDGIFTTSYPPHPESFNLPGPMNKTAVRHYLNDSWARWSNVLKFQPLFAIDYYFGETYAVYYAFYGFYIRMLIVPAIVSVIIFAVNYPFVRNNEEYNDMCDEKSKHYIGNLPVCPSCDTCNLTKVKDLCDNIETSSYFDNYASSVFAIFMIIWLLNFFVKYFRRRIAELRYYFDIGLEKTQDLNEFQALIEDLRYGRILQILSKQLNKSVKNGFFSVISLATLSFWIMVSVAWVVALTLYNIIMSSTQFQAVRDLSDWVDANLFISKNMFDAFITFVVYCLIVSVLDVFWGKFAFWLTDLDRPSSLKRYVEKYTWKIFFIALINNYGYLMYTALLRPILLGRPGAYNYIGLVRWDNCAIQCNYDLNYLLFFFVCRRFMLTLVLYFLWPKLKKAWRQRKQKKGYNRASDYQSWEEDYSLIPVSELKIHAKYAELIAELGYVTFFPSAFPYAPCFALFFNLLILRMEAQMTVRHRRRPIVRFSEDVATWFHMIEVMAVLSVIFNTFIFAFSTNTMHKYFYYFYFAVINQKNVTREHVGAVQFTLSSYSTNDLVHKPSSDYEVCYYKDFRYGPEHPYQYQITPVWGQFIGFKALFMVTVGIFVVFFSYIQNEYTPTTDTHLEKRIEKERHELEDKLTRRREAQKKFRDRLLMHDRNWKKKGVNKRPSTVT